MERPFSCLMGRSFSLLLKNHQRPGVWGRELADRPGVGLGGQKVHHHRTRTREHWPKTKIDVVSSTPFRMFIRHSLFKANTSTLQNILRICRIKDAVFRLGSPAVSATDEPDQAVRTIVKPPVRALLQVFKCRQIHRTDPLAAIDLTQRVPGHAPTRSDHGMTHPGPFHRLRQGSADRARPAWSKVRAADIPRDHSLVRPDCCECGGNAAGYDKGGYCYARPHRTALRKLSYSTPGRSNLL